MIAFRATFASAELAVEWTEANNANVRQTNLKIARIAVSPFE
jgi:hypothetical protein